MTPNVRSLFEQKNYPVFQNRMHDSEKEARDCPKGDIKIVENLQTGLVYNELFRPELMNYDGHYQNEQGVSRIFQTHLEGVVQILERTMGCSGIVEVGCGKGLFLELLLTRGFDITGFDPTYEGQNPRIRKTYFDPGSGIQANGLVLRHVLEHIQNPVGFLDGLKQSNTGGGKIYIEVPCFDWICKHRAWFDVFYEHVNYFRLSDFGRMFGTIHESGHLFGGQYIYVVADLASLRQPGFKLDDQVLFPLDFSASIDGSNNLRRGEAAIWGGASKGVIFALLKERVGQAVGTVIDINPAKQGKYLASTGLRVRSPTEALPLLKSGSTIYVMNSNYLEEIKKMSNNAFIYIGVDHE